MAFNLPSNDVYIEVRDEDVSDAHNHNLAVQEVSSIFESLRRFTRAYQSFFALFDRLTQDELFEFLYGYEQPQYHIVRY